MTKRLYNPAVIDNMSVRTVEGTLLISWTTFSLGSSKPRKSRFPHGEQPRQPLRRNSPRVRELSSFSPQATGPDDSCFGVPLATLPSSCIPRPPHAPRNGYDRNRKQYHCNKDLWHRSPLHYAPRFGRYLSRRQRERKV